MPLPREVDYWNGIAQKCVHPTGLIADNVWKRPEQIKRLLSHDWIDQKVLEIGTGNGMVAGALKVIVQGHWKYVGTELSSHFRNAVGAMFQLDTVSADVSELPGEGYTRIIAFDSLEHVSPQQREAGYKRIYDVAAKDALLFLHFSYGVSAHDKAFDHPFGLEDLVRIEKAGFTMMSYERYDCICKNGPIPYAFCVFRKL